MEDITEVQTQGKMYVKRPELRDTSALRVTLIKGHKKVLIPEKRLLSQNASIIFDPFSKVQM